MQLSETIKLYPTKYQFGLMTGTMGAYISAVNGLVSDAVSGTSIAKHTSKDVNADLPSALKNQCVRDAKSIVKKHYKDCHKAVLKNRKLVRNPKTADVHVLAPSLPVLKKPCCYINNQNFKIKDGHIEFPVMVSGKSTRISVSTRMTDKQKELFATVKLGTMRIVMKGKNMVAQVVYEVEETALPESVNEEQRIMKDIDHKNSHDIIETAVAHNVKVIKLEQLQNVRSTTRTSRKNNPSLHTWSFYRLAMYIEYKARLAGIKVVYVNPAYTSRSCPVCGRNNHANDRHYICECGFHAHRDLVGAVNICNSTEYVGDNNIRHTA